MSGVSVVIPTYNYGRFIRKAIESALGQTHAPLEIIVVDDGSNDHTAEVVKSFGAGVRYIYQPNHGVCAARNLGASLTRGDLITFLDADDWMEPEKIETQARLFGDDPDIGLVHSGIRKVDALTGETLAIELNGLEGWVWRDLLLWERPAIIGPGGTIMVRRAVFDAVGGFDARMKVGEDWDFCYRTARKFRVGFVPAALVNYRVHGHNSHRDVDKMESGMGLFYEKAFSTTDSEVLELRRRSLGNYHRVLAGSFLHSRRMGKFLSHFVRSIVYRPGLILRYFGFSGRQSTAL